MRTIRPRAVLVAAAVTGCAIALAGPAAAQAGGPTIVPATWQIELKVTGPNFPQFSAVTATSETSAWAFEDEGSAVPAAYQFNGATWTKVTFPAAGGDDVFGASSSSPTNVWAFTFKGEALRFNGTWSKMHHFSKPIGSGLAVNNTDVWVFGEADSAPHPLGTWNYNGSGWTEVSSGAGLFGASALSTSNIWAYGTTSIGHWTGSTWKLTSVQSLLPKKTKLSRSFLTGIYAASSKSVYAIASGGRQDEGGPLVLLHYNGHTWSRVADLKNLGSPVSIAPDGSGGLWIPVVTGFPGNATMEHFTNGALHNVTLPYSPTHLFLFSVANAPDTGTSFAVGFYRKSFSASTVTAVILGFGV